MVKIGVHLRKLSQIKTGTGITFLDHPVASLIYCRVFGLARERFKNDHQALSCSEWNAFVNVCIDTFYLCQLILYNTFLYEPYAFDCTSDIFISVRLMSLLTLLSLTVGIYVWFSDQGMHGPHHFPWSCWFWPSPVTLSISSCVVKQVAAGSCFTAFLTDSDQLYLAGTFRNFGSQQWLNEWR